MAEMQFLEKLFAYGPLGVIAVLFAVLWYRKDVQLTTERKEHAQEMRELEGRYITKAETWVAKYQDLAQAQDSTIKALRAFLDERSRS